MSDNEQVDLRQIAKESLQSIIPLLHRRNPALSQELLGERVGDMAKEGFRCVGAYHDTALVGIAGFWIKTRYHTGRVIEPDSVFVEAKYRGLGIGKRLMAWIYEFGREQECLESELHCYVSNSDAHRFWMGEGYKIIAFHFGKNL